MWIEALRSVPSSPPSSSVGLEGGHRAARRRLAPGRLDVVDREGDVVDAVAVLADVLGDLAIGGQRRGEHEADVVLDHHVAGPVTDLGLEAAERDRGEAPQSAVVVRGLARVADPELDVVDALEREEVGRLVVGVRVDPGAGLVGGAARDDLCHQQVSAAVGVGRSAGARPAGGLGRQCYARRATLARMDDLLDRLQAARTDWPPPARPSRPARPGRWPRSTTIGRGTLGAGRGPRPPGRDGAVLAGRDRTRAGRRARPGAVRPDRDGPGPDRARRARPLAPATGALRPDRGCAGPVRSALAEPDRRGIWRDAGSIPRAAR